MAEETIDAGLLEQTKNQIRTLVAEIADLAESDIQPAEFQVEFLNRAVAAVAASGGALWMLDSRNALKLQQHLGFQATGLMDGRVRPQTHDALLGVMMQASSAQIIPPGAAVEGVPNAGNPTGFALIIAPLVVDKVVVGLVEILMDPTRRAATQKSTLRFVSDLCDLAATYIKNRQMRQVLSQQRLWNQLEGFAHVIHSSLDLKETAFAVVNDGKRLVGCDRLSVCLKIGGRPLIEAVSGQEIVEQRANLIREMTKLCKVVMRSGEDLVYTGNTEGFAPDIRDALEMYVDESGAKAVIITLLHKPEPDISKDKVIFGALVAEQIGDEMAPTDSHARTEVVSRHASTALWNSSEADKAFMPMLKLLGSPWRFFRGRTLAKILAVLFAITSVVAVLCFVPWELTIEGRGQLLPAERRNTYAPHQATVVAVPFDHGDQVKQGDVIAKLESKDLVRELRHKMGERQEAETRWQSLDLEVKRAPANDQERLKGQLQEAKIKARSLREQIDIINEQIDLLEVRSPQDGIITSWEVKKTLLGKPVEIGEPLIQVAATDGDWTLEVQVPDDDMAPILDAQRRLDADMAAGKKPAFSKLECYFVSATDPEHRYRGYVKQRASKAELQEGKHNVKLTIGFSDAVRDEFLLRNQALRPGAEVRARIECGKARLAYVLLRDVIHVWYETVLFRWPFLQN